MSFCGKCGFKLDDGFTFCPKCGASSEVPGNVASRKGQTTASHGFKTEQKNPPKPKARTTSESEAHEEEPKRCPACGEIVGLNDFACPACGHELRRVTDGSINDLYRRLEEIEAGRTSNEEKSEKGVSRTDALKANAVRYFPIPNTKQDLLEFLVMAKANSQEGDANYEKVVIDAWRSKFDQAYDKAEALFGSDEDFSKFEKIKGRNRPLRIDQDNLMILIILAMLLGSCLVMINKL